MRWLPLVLLFGCATLVAGGPDQIPVATNPPGAYVYVNGTYVGQTPTYINLNRSSNGLIQLYLPGFQPVGFMRGKHLNGWFILSCLLFPFIVPPVVDLATGDWQRFDDSAIAIGLTPAQGPPPNWYVPGQPNQQPPAPPAPNPPTPGQPLEPAPYVPPGAH